MIAPDIFASTSLHCGKQDVKKAYVYSNIFQDSHVYLKLSLRAKLPKVNSQNEVPSSQTRVHRLDEFGSAYLITRTHCKVCTVCRFFKPRKHPLSRALIK